MDNIIGITLIIIGGIFSSVLFIVLLPFLILLMLGIYVFGYGVGLLQGVKDD